VRPARTLNPRPVGIVFLLVVLAAMVAALNVRALPFIGSGTGFSAAFSEAAGLREGNDVRVGGVKVGRVTDVSLEGTHVRVDFAVEEVRLTSETEALIEIGTLLGNKYLTLVPGDGEPLDPDQQIPLAQTTAPYDIVPAFADLTRTVEDIDTAQLAEAFTTLADTFRDAPPHVRGALDGVSRLSETLVSRDAALTELLDHTEGLTEVLAGRRTELTKLMGDGSLLLRELDARQRAIADLLVGTAHLAEQLSGLVDDNAEVIGPVLADLEVVTGILAKNSENLRKSVAMLYPTTRSLIDTVGTGPWYDAILENMTFIPQVPGLDSVTPAAPGVARTLGELLGVTPTEAGR
jgi:phospholipid/cholesterol/gamma-HCH transport system substrate-binding protein